MPILGTIASSARQDLSVGSYESIQSVTVASGQTFIDFTSIPQTYKHLQIRGIVRRSAAQTFAGFTTIQFNGDTSSSNYYSIHRINGRGDGLVYPSGGSISSSASIGLAAGNSMRASLFVPLVTDILEYTATNKTKVMRGFTGAMGQGTSTDNDVVVLSSMWNSTAAITSIRVLVAGADFVQHTVLSLYGIKG